MPRWQLFKRQYIRARILSSMEISISPVDECFTYPVKPVLLYWLNTKTDLRVTFICLNSCHKQTCIPAVNDHNVFGLWDPHSWMSMPGLSWKQESKNNIGLFFWRLFFKRKNSIICFYLILLWEICENIDCDKPLFRKGWFRKIWTNLTHTMNVH